MKKTLALVLAITMLFVLFAACNKSTSGTAESNPPTSAPDKTQAPATSNPSETTAPVQTDAPTQPTQPVSSGPYKFPIDENGFATEPYEYELPLTTSDETFSFWTVVWTPQYLPEDGYAAMDYPKGFKEYTGVNIEYLVIPSDGLRESFSTLLAADDLPDLMASATYYYTGGTPKQAVEDGYFLNIWEYKDCAPNYFYQVLYADPMDKVTKDVVFYEKELVVSFQALLQQAFIACNYMARGDWLEELGLSNDEILTWDDLYNMMTLFKTQIEGCTYPWPMFSSMDSAGNYAFTAYDTLPALNPYGVQPFIVVDGEVRMAQMNEADKAQLQKFNEFYAAGLIDPNWTAYSNNTSFTAKTTGGEVGYVYMSPGEITDYENTSIDPDATWVPIHKPLVTKGQTIHCGGAVAHWTYGSTAISAKCENLELAVTWCDWRYSPFGAEYSSWGPEGLIWEYDENGNRMATEWALSAPNGLGYAWLCMLYGCNSLAEHCLEDGLRKYAYPGGERILNVHYYWNDYSYDGAYQFPQGARLDTDESEIVTKLATDIGTYIAENYPLFLNGEKSFDEWDSYIEGLYNLKVQTVLDNYQTAYDRYMEING